MPPAIYWEVAETVNKLKSMSPVGFMPRVALTLGTGLGKITESLDMVLDISYQELEGFAHSTVTSHYGRLHLGYWHGLPVAMLAGRWHLYEGYEPAQITFPLRVLAQWGSRVFIFTNAAGGLQPNMRAGKVMLITDHLNLTGRNPLIGMNVDAWGPRFPDMSRVYDPELLGLARQVAEENGIDYYQGVYAGLSGPSLETPAETRMLQIMGAQAVGMSTVLEVIAAHHHGGRVLAMSAISNVNNPDDMQATSLADVLDGAALASQDMQTILGGVLSRLEQL